jgi:microsomal dipeptidase-like Zn-dependent dipeptidase
MAAFASSAGWGKGFELTPDHPGNGLTEFGKELIYELNRLGSESQAYLAHQS